jgi:hypothetical protein
VALPREHNPNAVSGLEARPAHAQFALAPLVF